MIRITWIFPKQTTVEIGSSRATMGKCTYHVVWSEVQWGGAEDHGWWWQCLLPLEELDVGGVPSASSPTLTAVVVVLITIVVTWCQHSTCS